MADPSVILIADGGPVVRRLVGALLAHNGYRVHEAQDGETAIRQAASLKLHLAEKKTRLPLYRPTNPFLLLSVVAPQLAYLAWWKRRRGQQAGALSERLNRMTLGYVAVFRKG